MNRRNWLWAALLAVPVAVAGVVYANSHTRSFTCPLTGEQLPCEKCCPLNEKNQLAQEQPYICPVTGKELACPNCCPLNSEK